MAYADKKGNHNIIMKIKRKYIIFITLHLLLNTLIPTLIIALISLVYNKEVFRIHGNFIIY